MPTNALAPILRAASAFTRRRPIQVEGRTLDPGIAAMIAIDDVLYPHGRREVSVHKARANYRQQAVLISERRLHVAIADEITVSGAAGPLAARLYVPRAAPDGRPTIMYLHGGGFISGDLDTHDATCRRLAINTGSAVVSVAYRLAPEHPFPAAYDDSLAAWDDVRARVGEWDGDPERVAIAGDSAGGNLALGVCLARSGTDAPCAALLWYPGADMTCSLRSHRTFSDGFLLTEESLQWFHGHYVPNVSLRTDVRASPYFAEDLSGLPPTLVSVAGFDPLCDEGLAVGTRAAEQGASVETVCHDSLPHGFAQLGGVSDASREAVAADTAWLYRTLHGDK